MGCHLAEKMNPKEKNTEMQGPEEATMHMSLQATRACVLVLLL
jgi:hypothetical protein